MFAQMEKITTVALLSDSMLIYQLTESKVIKGTHTKTKIWHIKQQEVMERERQEEKEDVKDRKLKSEVHFS